MSKTSLRDTQGWTPVIDSIIEKRGITTALVFGIIWRYCQMEGHTCYASQETLAQAIQVSRQTINSHADILVVDGYLEKIERHGHPSIYKDTGKAGLRIQAFDEGVNEIDTPNDEGVNQVDSRCKPALQGVSTPFTGGVNQVDTNKTINTPLSTQKNKTKKAPNGAEPKPSLFPIAQILAEVTG
jgi:DNA-binding transcriptional MocR family regulator